MMQQIEIKLLRHRDEYYTLLVSYNGKTFCVSVRVLGAMIDSKKCILLHHPLSYDISSLSSNWWFNIIGLGNVLDTLQYRILVISAHDIINNCNPIDLYDTACIENEILSFFKIDRIFCNIGGSFGGAMAIAFSVVSNKIIDKTIVISATCKLHSNQILYRRLLMDIINNAKNKHVMMRIIQKLNILFYRTPYDRTIIDLDRYLLNCELILPVINPELYFIMLSQLNDFSCPSHLLATIEGEIFLIYSSSDALYLPEQMLDFYNDLINLNKKAFIYELFSNKGHDAFLIEQEKISELLSNILEF